MSKEIILILFLRECRICGTLFLCTICSLFAVYCIEKCQHVNLILVMDRMRIDVVKNILYIA